MRHLIVFCLILLFSISVFAGKTRIMVLGLEAEGVDRATAVSAIELLTAKISGSGNFDIVDRNQVLKVLKSDNQETQSVPGIDLLFKTGKLFAVSKVVAGGIYRKGERYMVAARILDIESDKVIFSEEEVVIGKDRIIDGCNTLAGRIIFLLTGKPARLSSLEKEKLASGCVSGDSTACFNLAADLYLTAKQERVRSRALFEKSCEKGFGKGCHYAGVIYLRGLAGSPDFSRAVSLFYRGCKEGFFKSCEAWRSLSGTPEKKDVVNRKRNEYRVSLSIRELEDFK